VLKSHRQKPVKAVAKETLHTKHAYRQVIVMVYGKAGKCVISIATFIGLAKRIIQREGRYVPTGKTYGKIKMKGVVIAVYGHPSEFRLS
jgi:hypothetical protein